MKLNKKGFTLVELLAVIVILAVVMLVAVTAVGPAITNSKKGTFFSSASAMVDAAALWSATNAPTSTVCKKASTLASTGFLQKKDSKFFGAVLITVGTNNTYTYTIFAANNDYSAGSATAPVDISTIRTSDNVYTLGTTKLTEDPTKLGSTNCD